MSRTRAERRYNTHVKTSARLAIACRGDNWIPGGCCGGKIGLDGEARTCEMCNFSDNYERDYWKSLDDIRMVGWLQAQD